MDSFINDGVTTSRRTTSIEKICDDGRGRVINKKYLYENKGVFPVYSSQTENEGVFGYINTFDFDGEYLTWTTDGVYAGTVFYRQGKFNCTNVCGTLKIKDNRFKYKYLCHLLNRVTKFYVNHVGNDKLMNSDMKRIIIPFVEENLQDDFSIYVDKYDKLKFFNEQAFMNGGFMGEAVRTIIINNIEVNCTMLKDIDSGRIIISVFNPKIKPKRFKFIREKNKYYYPDEQIIFDADSDGNICKETIVIQNEKYDVYYEIRKANISLQLPYLSYFGLSIISGLDSKSSSYEDIVAELRKNGFSFIPSYEVLEEIHLKIPQIRKVSTKTLVSSLEEYKKEINKIRLQSENNNLWFRGHSYFLYSLTPTLYRGLENYYENEDAMFEEYVDKIPQYFDNKKTVEKMAIMQHYGLPTRLLDITKDMYIALYFACCDKDHRRGEVFVFDNITFSISSFDSPEVTVLANLSKLTYDEKNILRESYEKGMIDNNIWNKLMRLSCDEGIDCSEVKPDVLDKKIFISGDDSVPRMSIQKGGFIIFGLPSIADMDNAKSFIDHRRNQLFSWNIKSIYICNKNQILKELNKIGINKSTVFPNLVGNATRLKKKYKKN